MSSKPSAVQATLDPSLNPEALEHYIMKGSMIRFTMVQCSPIPGLGGSPPPRAVAAMIPSFKAEQKMHCRIECTLDTWDFWVLMR